MTLRTPRATLGGVPLATIMPVSWAEAPGVEPSFQEFQVHEKQWEKIKEFIGSPVELRIKSDTADELVWKNLYVLREVPSSAPFRRGFLVADVRWKWPRVLVSRSYNIPRKTGARRMLGGDPIELLQVVDTPGYAITSLNDLKKWTARDYVEDILKRVAAKCGHEYVIESFPINPQRQVTVEGQDVTENGDTAIGHALAHAPGAEITVDKFGRAVVYNATDRAAVERAIGPRPTRLSTAGVERRVDLSRIRPSRVMVYFQREVELRFDSIEEDDDATVQTYRDPGENPEMTMENVIPLPDPVTTIRGEQVAQGSYVPILDAITAWNDDLSSIGRSKAPPALTLANIRKYWFLLETLYTPLGNLTVTAAQSNWVARISAIRAHYRQTYRIRSSWMQRMRGLQATRVGVLDYYTRTRNPARAWSQFTMEPTTKALVLGYMAKTDKHWYWINVDNYPGIDANLDDTSSSPASVQIVEADLGIVHINYRMDPHGMRAQVHPSMMREGGTGKIQACSRDLSKQLTDIMCVDGHCRGTAPIGLSDDFRVAVVFTASPFAPNDESRLFGYEVKPEALTDSVVADFEITGGRGPIWELYCHPALMTARYALTDTVQGRDGAKRLFGFDKGLPVPGSNSPTEVPGYNIVNLGLGADGLIQAVANAMAVAQWASFVSQVEGTISLHLKPNMELRGSMDSVRHVLMPNGALSTVVSMSGMRRAMDPMALIPPSLRAAILGDVEGGVA